MMVYHPRLQSIDNVFVQDVPLRVLSSERNLGISNGSPGGVRTNSRPGLSVFKQALTMTFNPKPANGQSGDMGGSPKIALHDIFKPVGNSSADEAGPSVHAAEGFPAPREASVYRNLIRICGIQAPNQLHDGTSEMYRPSVNKNVDNVNKRKTGQRGVRSSPVETLDGDEGFPVNICRLNVSTRGPDATGTLHGSGDSSGEPSPLPALPAPHGCPAVLSAVQCAIGTLYELDGTGTGCLLESLAFFFRISPSTLARMRVEQALRLEFASDYYSVGEAIRAEIFLGAGTPRTMARAPTFNTWVSALADPGFPATPVIIQLVADALGTNIYVWSPQQDGLSLTAFYPQTAASTRSVPVPDHPVCLWLTRGAGMSHVQPVIIGARYERALRAARAYPDGWPGEARMVGSRSNRTRRTRNEQRRAPPRGPPRRELRDAVRDMSGMTVLTEEAFARAQAEAAFAAEGAESTQPPSTSSASTADDETVRRFYLPMGPEQTAYCEHYFPEMGKAADPKNTHYKVSRPNSHQCMANERRGMLYRLADELKTIPNVSVFDVGGNPTRTMGVLERTAAEIMHVQRPVLTPADIKRAVESAQVCREHAIDSCRHTFLECPCALLKLAPTQVVDQAWDHTHGPGRLHGIDFSGTDKGFASCCVEIRDQAWRGHVTGASDLVNTAKRRLAEIAKTLPEPSDADVTVLALVGMVVLGDWTGWAAYQGLLDVDDAIRGKDRTPSQFWRAVPGVHYASTVLAEKPCWRTRGPAWPMGDGRYLWPPCPRFNTRRTRPLGAFEPDTDHAFFEPPGNKVVLLSNVQQCMVGPSAQVLAWLVTGGVRVYAYSLNVDTPGPLPRPAPVVNGVMAEDFNGRKPKDGPKDPWHILSPEPEGHVSHHKGPGGQCVAHTKMNGNDEIYVDPVVRYDVPWVCDGQRFVTGWATLRDTPTSRITRLMLDERHAAFQWFGSEIGRATAPVQSYGLVATALPPDTKLHTLVSTLDAHRDEWFDVSAVVCKRDKSGSPLTPVDRRPVSQQVTPASDPGPSIYLCQNRGMIIQRGDGTPVVLAREVWGLLLRTAAGRPRDVAALNTYQGLAKNLLAAYNLSSFAQSDILVYVVPYAFYAQAEEELAVRERVARETQFVVEDLTSVRAGVQPLTGLRRAWRDLGRWFDRLGCGLGSGEVQAPDETPDVILGRCTHGALVKRPERLNPKPAPSLVKLEAAVRATDTTPASWIAKIPQLLPCEGENSFCLLQVGPRTRHRIGIVGNCSHNRVAGLIHRVMACQTPVTTEGVALLENHMDAWLDGTSVTSDPLLPAHAFTCLPVPTPIEPLDFMRWLDRTGSSHKAEYLRIWLLDIVSSSALRMNMHVTAFLKNEKANGKKDTLPRVISNRDPTTHVGVGRYMAAIADHLGASMGPLYGPALDKEAIENWVQSMREAYGSETCAALSSDASKCDASQSAAIWAAGFDKFVARLFPPNDHPVLWEFLHRRFATSGHMPLPAYGTSVAYCVAGTVSSGDDYTTIINTLIMIWGFLIAHWVLQTKHNTSARLAHGVFKGDDGLIFVEPSRAAEFREIYVGVFASFGFDMSGSVLTGVDQAEFCSCNFLIEPGRVRMVRMPGRTLDRAGYTARFSVREAESAPSGKKALQLGRAAALSCLVESAGLPVLQAYAEAYVRVTQGKPRWDRDLARKLEFSTGRAITERNYVKALDPRRVQAKPILYETRVAFEVLYGVTVAEQEAAEAYLARVSSRLAVLDHPVFDKLTDYQ